MKRESIKNRNSTQKRFVSVLRGGNPYQEKRAPWYFNRGNFFVLMMIVVFFFLYMATKVVLEVQKNTAVQPMETEEPMKEAEATPTIQATPTNEATPSNDEIDYDEAKRIFGGSG